MTSPIVLRQESLGEISTAVSENYATKTYVNETVATAKSYTDEKVSSTKTYVDEAVDEALTSAKSYTDEVSSANTFTSKTVYEYGSDPNGYFIQITEIAENTFRIYAHIQLTKNDDIWQMTTKINNLSLNFDGDKVYYCYIIPADATAIYPVKLTFKSNLNDKGPYLTISSKCGPSSGNIVGYFDTVIYADNIEIDS